MDNIVAISGASGRTGFPIAEEALARGQTVRRLVQPASKLPHRWPIVMSGDWTLASCPSLWRPFVIATAW